MEIVFLQELWSCSCVYFNIQTSPTSPTWLVDWILLFHHKLDRPVSLPCLRGASDLIRIQYSLAGQAHHQPHAYLISFVITLKLKTNNQSTKFKLNLGWWINLIMILSFLYIGHWLSINSVAREIVGFRQNFILGSYRSNSNAVLFHL